MLSSSITMILKSFVGLGSLRLILSGVPKKLPTLEMGMRSLAVAFVSTLQSTTSPPAGSSTHLIISLVISGALRRSPMLSHMALLLPTVLQSASFFRCFADLSHGLYGQAMRRPDLFIFSLIPISKVKFNHQLKIYMCNA